MSRFEQRTWNAREHANRITRRPLPSVVPVTNVREFRPIAQVVDLDEYRAATREQRRGWTSPPTGSAA